jgi:hypothetical protein
LRGRPCCGAVVPVDSKKRQAGDLGVDPAEQLQHGVIVKVQVAARQLLINHQL